MSLKVSYTLEPDAEGDVVLYEHGVYPRGSVLEGSPRRAYIKCYRTVAEALEANPDKDIEVLAHSTKVEHTMPDTPPSWFNPLEAGESW